MKFKVAGIVSTMAIMAVLSGAQAQTSNSESNSSSGAVSGSSSNSGAAAISRGGNAANRNTSNQGVSTNTGATVNQTYNTSGQQGVTYSGGTSNSTHNSQSGYTSSDNTVRAAPTVYAPPVSGGSPCSLGYSAGASFLGWGAAAGGQVVDAECERRMHVAMLYNAGWKGASKELACNNKEVYMAFRTAGEPCAPRAQWEGNVPVQQPMPMVQQQPVVVTPPVRTTTAAPTAPREYPRCNPRAGITDNCRS